MLKRLFGLVLCVATLHPISAKSCNDSDRMCCSQFKDACCDLNFECSLDWLYWSVNRLGPLVAVQAQGSSGDRVELTTQPKSDIYQASLQHTYQSGVRARIGLWKEDICGLFIDYLSYCPSEDQCYQNGLDQRFSYTIITPLQYAQGFNALSEYELDYQRVTVALASKICRLETFELVGYMGARFAWLDERVSARFFRNELVYANEFTHLDYKASTNIDAYGVVFGIDTFKECFCGFGLELRADFAAYYACQDASIETDNNSILTYIGTEGIFKANLNNDQNCLLASIDLAVGLALKHCRCGCITFSTAFGYEFHHWLNYPDFIVPLQASGTDTDGLNIVFQQLGNIGFDGIYLRIKAEF